MLQHHGDMSRTIPVHRWTGSDGIRTSDEVVIEEPLEIRLNGQSLAITMRTPGQDDALAAGFLLTEGIISAKTEIWDIQHCASPESPELLNIIEVTIPPGRMPDDIQSGRQRYSNSSCGVCGKASIEAIRRVWPPISDPPHLSSNVLYSLPERLRSEQQTFSHTGGLHASGVFTEGGDLLFLAEDVGRHNAVDKAIGMALMEERDLNNTVMMVSGRAGFEIIQKALAARIPAVCSVSAPSSLAVDLARESGMILIGFLRGQTMNIYSGEEQIRIK